SLFGLGLSRLQLAPKEFPRPVSRWTTVLPNTAPSDIALSKDGAHLVYAQPAAGADSLILVTMDRQEIRPLPGTATALRPVFSPDGQLIAFFDGENLGKVAISGGPPDHNLQSAGAARTDMGGRRHDRLRYGGWRTYASARGGRRAVAPDNPRSSQGRDGSLVA